MRPSPSFSYPASVELARLPTPLQSMTRLSAQLPAEVLCKRDDLTGCVLSGNKVRKLEFLLAEALDLGCRGVVTCGGEQSNHARATAAAAARLGLRCHLLLRTADLQLRPDGQGTATVQEREFRGVDTQYWVSLPSGRVLLCAPRSDPSLDVGQRVNVSPTTERAFVVLNGSD